LEQQDLNKRLLLALVLSFIVFIGYGYLFPATKPVQQKQEATTTSAHNTPTATKASPSAPNVASNTTVKSAPVQTDTAAVLATLKSKNFKVSIDEFGRIGQVSLLEDKFKTKEGDILLLFKEGQVKPLEVRFADVKLNEEAFTVPYVNSGEKSIDIASASQTLTLTQKLSTLTVTKKITFNPNGQYDVSITTSKPTQFFVTPGHRPEADDMELDMKEQMENEKQRY